ncbi:MAG: polysaccharide pyruvyl transferase family protein [Planctomycetes bacterium]|nr:polysaccharide pyruvyl transferase family protein [Planctomycetota bacterium]
MPRALAFINPRLSTSNAGDVFIEDSLKRILVYDPERSVDVDPRKPITRAEIDAINSTEAAVIAGTSLWYRELRKPGRWTFRLEDLRAIRVPIIPAGVGTSRAFDEDDGFSAETREQLRWIHGSCALGSARDPRTAEALAKAGIHNVSLTGCPTLFRSLEPRWELRAGKAARRVTVTLRSGQKHNARRLLCGLRELGLEPVIAAQKPRDRLGRLPLPFLARPPESVFGFDIAPYLRLVEETAGAAGWRLHGNMLHLACGNPAVFFANNSRGVLLRGVRAPVRALSGPRADPARDRARARGPPARPRDLPFPARWAAARAEMARFLEANGLEHRLGAG